jgi:hypothetical protein
VKPSSSATSRECATSRGARTGVGSTCEKAAPGDLAHARAQLRVGRQLAHEAIVEAQGGHELQSKGDNAGYERMPPAVSTEPEPGAAPPDGRQTAATPGRTSPGACARRRRCWKPWRPTPACWKRLAPEERARFQARAGLAFHPDRKARRKRLKAQEKARTPRRQGARRRPARRHRHPHAAAQAGVPDARTTSARRCRPTASGRRALPPTAAARSTLLPRRARRLEAPLLRVQAEVHHAAHFYDQLCPDCGEFNFRKRTETADLRGRVALLTGGRVKIGYQAGLKAVCAPAAKLIVTTRFPGRQRQPLRRGGRLRRLGRAPVRSTAWTCATRRAWRPSARNPGHARAPGLHRQQRLPDRAPAAGLLRAHARARARGAREASSDSRALVHLLDEHLEHAPGLARAPELSQLALLPEDVLVSRSCSRKASSTPTCSRSTCANAIPGACSWTRSARSSCWKCSW